MLVTQVQIENFKRFANLTVGLRQLDCLVGPNNSGKTTLLQALALFDFCLHHCLSGKNGTLELKRRTISPEEFYVLPYSTPVDLWTDCRTQASGKHKVIRVSLTFDQGRSVSAAVELNFNRFGVSIESADQSQEWLQQLRQARISYLPVFSMFLPQEERKTPAIIEDALARGRVSTVIRNLLLNLKHENRQAELVAVLQRVFPALSNIAINFDEASDRYVSFTYREQERQRQFDVFSAGSGFQQFVYLFGFISLRQPTIVLLDEPDVHLHGALQRALLEELRRLAVSGRQVLFATHSRDMIERMSPEEILALEEDRAERLCVAYDIYDALGRLGSLEPTQLPRLQVYRRVLVVEDQADWDMLSAFSLKILGVPVWQQIERRVAICYARGNPWKQDMPRLRQQLQQMLPATGQPLEMFVLADRDYHPQLADLSRALPADRIQWHVWERTEIENYLLSPAGVLRTVRGHTRQPTLAEAALRAEFQRLLDSSRDSANDHLVKAFQEYGRSQDERWDAATLSRKAREYLQANWESGKLGLADAKEIVLPGVKRWLQGQGHGSFSDRALIDSMLPEDIPSEVHTLARRIAAFAGVATSDGAAPT